MPPLVIGGAALAGGIGTGTAAALAGGTALLGGISGAMGKKQSSDNENWVNAGPVTGRESLGTAGSDKAYSELRGLTAAGANARDVQNAAGGQRDLASMLQQMSASGGLPNAQDISTAGGFANQIFQARQVGLDQSFTQQNTEAERLAARLGRPVNDPIIQAKLRTGYMQQQDSLNAEKTGYGAQMALSLPGQRLAYAGQRSDVMNNLASQAFSNRAALLAQGSQLANDERNFRVQTATRGGTQNSTSGGGIGGAIDGALGGLAGGVGIANMMGAKWGGGGGLPSPGGVGPLANADGSGFSAAQGYGPMANPNSSSFFGNAPSNPFSGGSTRSLGTVTTGNPTFGPGTYGPQPMYGPQPFQPGFAATPVGQYWNNISTNSRPYTPVYGKY